MDLYLIRHTRLKGAEGICYGRSDVELSPDFPAEADEIKQKLSALENPVVYSSPSLRCRALADHLSPGQVKLVPELQELDFGTWEMKPWDSLPRESLEAWAGDFVNVACPQGESLRDMMARVLSFWDGPVTQEKSDAILVTHSGPVRIILSSLLNIAPREMFSLPVNFGGVWRIRRQAGAPPSVLKIQ